MGKDTTASDDPFQSSQFKAIFEQAFRNAPIGMDLTDRSGRFLQVNNTLCRMLGYSEQELLGMRWQDLTHPADIARSTERQKDTFEGRDVVEFT